MGIGCHDAFIELESTMCWPLANKPPLQSRIDWPWLVDEDDNLTLSIARDTTGERDSEDPVNLMPLIRGRLYDHKLEVLRLMVRPDSPSSSSPKTETYRRVGIYTGRGAGTNRVGA